MNCENCGENINHLALAQTHIQVADLSFCSEMCWEEYLDRCEGSVGKTVRVTQDSARPKSGYWYLFKYEECVLCGQHATMKTRIYDRPKPDDPAERHKFTQYACWRHFW